MKLLSGSLTLLMALIISAVAGYFSVIGLGHLFAGAFYPVIVMGTALETGKIVASTWLKANWSNPAVAWLHKLYLALAVLVLMAITALGVYGYLAKGHLEQEAPLASIELQIKGIEARSHQFELERTRLEQRLSGLDQAVNTLLSNSKTAKESQAADRARQAQRKDRLDIQKQIDAKNRDINKLSEELVPLKLKISDVSAKLGPVKYVAQLFGWQDPNTAVQMVIVMIMFAFDPLALVLVISGTITIGEWMKHRAERKAKAERQKVLADHDVAAINAAMETFVAPKAVANSSIFPEFPLQAPMPEAKVYVGNGTPDPISVSASSVEVAEQLAEKCRTVDALMSVNRSLTDERDALAYKLGTAKTAHGTEKAHLEGELVRLTDQHAQTVARADSFEALAMETMADAVTAHVEHEALTVKVEALTSALAEAKARPMQSVVPAVYGTVLPAGKGPVRPSASFGEKPWTGSWTAQVSSAPVSSAPAAPISGPFWSPVAGLDRGLISNSVNFTVTPSYMLPVQTVLNTSKTPSVEEKLTVNTVISDTKTVGPEDFHAFSETMFRK